MDKLENDMNIKLPIKIYDLAYWVHPVKDALSITEVIVEGYNIRADTDMDNFLVVIFRATRTHTRYCYRVSDVFLAPSRIEAQDIIQKIRSRSKPYPISRPQYEDEQYE